MMVVFAPLHEDNVNEAEQRRFCYGLLQSTWHGKGKSIWWLVMRPYFGYHWMNKLLKCGQYIQLKIK